MRYVYIDNVVEGMLLGKTIYNDKNMPLLVKGTPMTSGIVAQLQKKGLKGVYVDDEISHGIEIEELIPEQNKNLTIECLKRLDITKTLDNARDIVDYILAKKDLKFESLDYVEGDSVYKHSLDVCTLSVAVGIGLGYDKDRLVDLAVSALLHDVGKTCTDRKNFDKVQISNNLKARFNIQGDMGQYEYGMHTVYGYNLLENNVDVKATVKQGVLAHHENEDGSGFPLGLKSDKIYEFAKIIHVCDTYTEVMSKQVNGKPCCPSEALEYLMAGSGTKFNGHIVKTFMRYIPIYPRGMMVKLSNGMNAIVYQNSVSTPLRPIIRLENGQTIDLSKVLDITIVNVYDITEENKKTI